MTESIHPVILCGGSGTRLWPISRQSLPKPFVPLLGQQTLFDATVQRLHRLSSRLTVVASQAHRFLIRDALAGHDGQFDVVLEPVPRNTAMAIALAVIHAREQGHTLLLVCPCDHHIPDDDVFAQTVLSGVPAANAGAMVTFGIVPSYPATGFGYIESASDGGTARIVQSFTEKPNAATAQRFLLGGRHLWNAGIFLAQTDVWISAFETHCPDVWSAAQAALQPPVVQATDDSKVRWRNVTPEPVQGSRSISIDHAVMEHQQPMRVVPFAGQWSDVGNWAALADILPADELGNRLVGQALAYHSRNTLVHAWHRPAVAVGVENLLIVDTPDALLVAHRDSAEMVKDVVVDLHEKALAQAFTHRKVQRPWGWFDALDRGERFQVKRIVVKPGASLSLQMHHHRAEHWVVVKGTAEVTCGERVCLLQENQSTFIPLGTWHRLRNPGLVDLEIVEVQSGSYLGEDDIVRREDDYGRST